MKKSFYLAPVAEEVLLKPEAVCASDLDSDGTEIWIVDSEGSWK